jgi:hypothetical protein
VSPLSNESVNVRVSEWRGVPLSLTVRRTFLKVMASLAFPVCVKRITYDIDGVIGVSGGGGAEGKFGDVPLSISAGGEGPVDGFELSVGFFTDDGGVVDGEGEG